ncbi:MAG: Ig-like domain-containing protein [Paludibacteraceae bacterium]|nr:Ig-like domain-containing protein [Paludibacteraceae bacterium]
MEFTRSFSANAVIATATADDGSVISLSAAAASGQNESVYYAQLAGAAKSAADYYFEVTSNGSLIESVELLLATNKDAGATAQPVVLTWEESVQNNKADGCYLLDAKTLYKGYANADWWVYDFSNSPCQTLRIYRSVKGVDVAGHTASEQIGNNQTVYVFGVRVTLASSTPTNRLIWSNNLSNGATVNKQPTDADFTYTASSSLSLTCPITYSSSNTSVATINSTTGAVHLTGAEGKTTITATQGACGDYEAASTTYTLVVAEKPALDCTGKSISWSTKNSTLKLPGGSYEYNGKTYRQAGVYLDTTEYYAEGCPKKIYTITLNADTTATICYGGSFTWDQNGKTYTTKGDQETITRSVTLADGKTYNYTVRLKTIIGAEPEQTETSATIFQGEAYSWFGKTYTKTGIYTDTIFNETGCPATIGTLTLGVCGNVPDTGYVRAVINQGDTYYWKYRNISYIESTHDEFQFINKYGCDSVAVLDLTVQPVPSGHEAATICEGDTYEWYGMTLSKPGTYTHGSHTLHLGMLPNPQLETCPDQVIHLGESTQLTVTGADYYSWEPLDYLSSEWSDQPVANPPVTTMYHVKSYNSAADNVVANGDFEQGNTGFTTECTYETTGGVFGKYIISNDSYNMWSGAGSHTDHTSGSGNYMLIDGFATDNKVLWEQTVTVTPNTDYIFSAWFISLHTSIKYGSWAQLQFFVNDEPLGDVVESPHDGNSWGRYYELWDSKNNTTAKLTIKNQNINGSGNDFGIDDISFQALGPCFAEDSIKVTINFDIDLYDHCNHTIQTRNKDAQTHKVTYHVEGVDCTDQVGYYKPEDQLTIRAHATDPCVKFVRWSDGSTENPRIMTMGNSDLTITPVFERAKYTIHVESNNGAVGEVDIMKP